MELVLEEKKERKIKNDLVYTKITAYLKTTRAIQFINIAFKWIVFETYLIYTIHETLLHIR